MCARAANEVPGDAAHAQIDAVDDPRLQHAVPVRIDKYAVAAAGRYRSQDDETAKTVAPLKDGGAAIEGLKSIYGELAPVNLQVSGKGFKISVDVPWLLMATSCVSARAANGNSVARKQGRIGVTLFLPEDIRQV